MTIFVTVGILITKRSGTHEKSWIQSSQSTQGRRKGTPKPSDATATVTESPPSGEGTQRRGGPEASKRSLRLFGTSAEERVSPMTKVLSIRMPSGLERSIRHNADWARMTASDIVRLILMHARGGQFSFSQLPDFQQYLDAKLDVRLPEEIVSQLRAESERLRVSLSVYSRIILDAYYSKRLVFLDIGDRYTLAANHEQTKSA